MAKRLAPGALTRGSGSLFGGAKKKKPSKTSRAAAAAAASGAAPTANPAGDPNAWLNALQNDPTYVSDLAGITANNAAARARRDAAVKALMFQYNDPSNPYATTAQLARQEASDRANMTADRAARGVLASGGTKLQTQDIGYNYGKALYDALNSVTGQIGSLDADLADTERQGVTQQQQALDAATQNLIDAGYSPSVVAAAVKSATGGKVGSSMPSFNPNAGTGRVATGSVDAQGRPVALPVYHDPYANVGPPGSSGMAPGTYSTFPASKAPDWFTARVAAGSQTATKPISEAAAQEAMRRTYGPSRPGDADWRTPGSVAANRSLYPWGAASKRYPTGGAR